VVYRAFIAVFERFQLDYLPVIQEQLDFKELFQVPLEFRVGNQA
jgi:hypothetical protein